VVEEGGWKGDVHRLHNWCSAVCVCGTGYITGAVQCVWHRLRNWCLGKRKSDTGYITGVVCVLIFFNHVCVFAGYNFNSY